ncbi:hypothetical protein DPMN_022659 [Dreissena polymorpha]|uniref:Uncharacterized protein n=1 Tax=Dreissena polymorpha TaxID=45954 RepID=A0A9D4NKQ7_DREPO|nr:hypothetical protein DPMN_022659 [Dreissena polymorpha]
MFGLSIVGQSDLLDTHIWLMDALMSPYLIFVLLVSLPAGRSHLVDGGSDIPMFGLSFVGQSDLLHTDIWLTEALIYSLCNKEIKHVFNVKDL